MSTRTQGLRLISFTMVVLALQTHPAAVNGDTIYVCWDGSGDYLTIQEGIDAAQDGDEVVVCDGTYTGPGNKNLDFGGRSITVRSASGDPVLCIIDCEGDGRGFYFHSGEGPDSIVEGLTITNGSASNGGGVYCVRSSPTLTNCRISGNSADDGGGFYCHYNSSTLTNCTISGNSASSYGGGVHCVRSSPTLTNCILWDDTPEEIYVYSGSPVVTYSDVQGGWPGIGNIDADPLFVDPDGPDDDPDTWEDNDYHLSAGSPCIDAGCNWAVPPDTADLDEDGDTSEYTPLDLDGEGRFFDDPDMADTGCGCPPIVDMGAYEFGDAGPQPCPGDLDCDRVVGHSDLGILLSAWHWSDAGDLNCDGETDHADLGILLGHWGEGCP